MTNTIFVAGDQNVQAEKFISAAEEKFDNPQFIVYFRRETEEAKRITDQHNVCETIYDYQVQQMRPTTPNTDYLAEFEEEFGPGVLWRSVIGDSKITKSGRRYLFYDNEPVFNHQELLSNIEIRVKKIKEIFNNFDVTLMFMSAKDMKALISATICDYKDIPYYFVGHTHVAGKHALKKGNFTISGNMFEPFELEHAYEDALQNPEDYPFSEARDFINGIRKGEPLYTISQLQPENSTNQETDDEREATRFSAGKQILDTLKTPARFVRDGIKCAVYKSRYRRRDYYRDIPKFKKWHEGPLSKLRTLYLDNIFDFDSFDPNIDYIYFPLQAQPEVALMLKGRYYTHFDAVINNVAQSLPVGTELYVNDHPHMRNARLPTFYNRVRRLPNVRLLSMDIETRRVIQNAAAVICVNTTTGLEAAIHDTPVLTLANPDYTVIDGVTPIEGYEEIPTTVKRSIQDGVNTESVESYIAASLAVGKKKNDIELYRKSCDLIHGHLHELIMSKK